ncbi:MAG TPA: hypothetical protein VHK90_04225 [Thermoanaerobaculia bacterium]|nr:hypothetical protein [Thermoanaerobaculia bacterium]
MTERYCSNCRAELPPKADACPACGVYAGDIFDGKMPREKKPSSWGFWAGMLLLACVGAGYAVWMNRRPEQVPARKETPPEVRVVRDRPGGARRAAGAKVTEAEAIRLLRRHLVTTRNVKNECLAILSAGGGAYVFNVYDRCGEVRLGKWKVDTKTGAVSAASS